MKNIFNFLSLVFSFIVFCSAGIAQDQTLQINSDFPGGNIRVDSIQDGVVYLQPDLRDTRTNWFYWYFSIKSETSDSIRFVFTRPNCMTVKGPAVSTDDGRTWSWYFEQRISTNEFTFFLKAGHEYRFSMGMPYTQKNFDAFMRP